MNWKKKEMIVFDVFIDIESTDEFSDLFFQIFMISSEKSSPVKIEITVLVLYMLYWYNMLL